MVRLAHSADLRSRLRHVSGAPSVAYSTGCSRVVTHPGTNSRSTVLDFGDLTGTGMSPPLGRRPGILLIATKMVFPGERNQFPFHFVVRVSRADSQLTWITASRTWTKSF